MNQVMVSPIFVGSFVGKRGQLEPFRAALLVYLKTSFNLCFVSG